jgi:hypothetical protein
MGIFLGRFNIFPGNSSCNPYNSNSYFFCLAYKDRSGTKPTPRLAKTGKRRSTEMKISFLDLLVCLWYLPDVFVANPKIVLTTFL